MGKSGLRLTRRPAVINSILFRNSTKCSRLARVVRVGERRWPQLSEAQRAVLLEVLIHGSRSRADLSRRLGFSRTSLSRLSRELVAEGEIRPVGGRGRPSEMLLIRPDAAAFAGIKLTGDALYVAVTDLHATVTHAEEHRLDSRDVDRVVAQIGRVVTGLRAARPNLAAVGVCLAGDVDDSGARSLIVGSHFLGWDRVALSDLVGAATGLPAVAANDVQSLTTAHHWFGAGIGLRSFAVIGLGQGIGAGIVVNDQVIRGSRGHPGKIGHLPVAPVTAGVPVCDRGHPGCVSAYVTAPAIVKNAGVRRYDKAVDRAREGEPRALEAFRAAGRALGAACATIVNLADPEKVIVTGEGLAVLEFGRDALDASLREALDPAAEPVPVEAYPFNFGHYARAAAISAIRSIVGSAA
jgi:predicted NBD/HSP70 family sugar kinase